MNGPDCIEAQECRGDFWAMLEEAMCQCGGNPATILSRTELPGLGPDLPAMADMPLRAVVEVLAQNGIRMVYIPSKHIDRIASPRPTICSACWQVIRQQHSPPFDTSKKSAGSG